MIPAPVIELAKQAFHLLPERRKRVLNVQDGRLRLHRTRHHAGGDQLPQLAGEHLLTDPGDPAPERSEAYRSMFQMTKYWNFPLALNKRQSLFSSTGSDGFLLDHSPDLPHW